MSDATFWTVVLFIAVAPFMLWYGWASYEECRRVHPGWYCIGP